MTRLSLLLSALVILLLAGLPFLYADLRYRTYRNFRVVDDGVVYRSGQMSRAGFERVCREKGVRTVIKLRDDDERKPADVALDDAEEAYCKARGIEFVRLSPRIWEEEPTLALLGGGAAKTPTAVPMGVNLREFESLILREKLCPRPVLVHCFAGIHRTGSHVAVYRVLFDNYTPAEAMAEFKSCGKLTSTYEGNLVPYMADVYLPDLYERVHGRPVGEHRR